LSLTNFKDINLVIIDSNFLLLPYQFKIDYLNEIYLNLEGKIRFYIFKQSLNELEAKIRRESKTRKLQRQFKAAMNYLDKNEKIYPIYFVDEVKIESETTDEFLLRKCNEFKKEYKKIFLATNDSELRTKAKNSKINVIFLRQKRFLFIDRG
jgi:rRNA-processing protein FCF1